MAQSTFHSSWYKITRIIFLVLITPIFHPYSVHKVCCICIRKSEGRGDIRIGSSRVDRNLEAFDLISCLKDEAEHRACPLRLAREHDPYSRSSRLTPIAVGQKGRQGRVEQGARMQPTRGCVIKQRQGRARPCRPLIRILKMSKPEIVDRGKCL